MMPVPKQHHFVVKTADGGHVVQTVTNVDKPEDARKHLDDSGIVVVEPADDFAAAKSRAKDLNGGVKPPPSSPGVHAQEPPVGTPEGTPPPSPADQTPPAADLPNK